MGAGAVVALLAINIALTARNIRQLKYDEGWVTHTQLVVDSLDNLLSLTKDAEIEQRSFIITGQSEYLAPYSAAIAAAKEELKTVSRLTRDNPQQQARIPQLETRLTTRLSDLDKTIELREQQGFTTSQQVLSNGRGAQEMRDLRSIADEMIATEQSLLAIRLQKYEQTYRIAILTGLLSGFSALATLIALLWLTRRYLRARTRAAAIIVSQSETLKKDRARLALALAIADLGQWDVNLRDRTTERNLRHDQIFGYDSPYPNWTYETFLEHVLPADRKQVNASFKQAIATGESWEVECRIQRTDGEQRWIWIKGSLYQDEGDRQRRMLGVIGDITAHKQAEEEIREARSRLASTLAAGEVGTWNLDVLNGTIQADANLARMFAVTPKEAEGGLLEAYTQAIHPEDVERVNNSITQALESGTDYEASYRLINANGEIRWIVARGRVERDEVGQSVRLPGVAIDITAQRRVEEQLRASERRFQQIADTMPQMVWVTRADGYHEYFNRRWYEYIGCTPEECIGYGWNQPLHLEDRQMAIERWNHSLQTGEPYEVEYRFCSQAGEYRWFLARALPIRDDAGQIVKWFGTCTDIEAFKQAQEDRNNFVRLADNTSDFIGMFDLEGKLFYVNAAGRNRVGIDSLEAANQINIIDLFFPEDRFRIFNEFLPAVRERGSGTTEIRVRHLKTSEAIWMSYNVTVLTNSKGEPTGLATISQDTTERRKMEQDLRQFANDLSEADRYKDEFLATLAHELRNPLAPIRNGLKIMQLAPDNAEAVERVRAMMDRQIAQMVRLVDDLLDVSRISRGKIELTKERVEIAAVIEQAIETSRPAIEAAEHRLTVSLPAEPVYLFADTVRLTQVFSNLLNNASKYSDPKGEIALSAEQRGQEVVVSIKDRGIGIDAEMLPEIFGIFKQVSGTGTKSQGGLGIGLTLVEQLVKMHGGSVSAFSEGQGQGSEFVVCLPLGISLAEKSALLPTAMPINSVQIAARRILVVVDNEDSARSLSMLFEIKGYEVHIAYDGQAAVEAADAFRPEIILLDIGLPIMNGYEAARTIRAQPWGRDIVIVALSGWGQPEDRLKSKEVGFNAHEVKPVDHNALLYLLASLTASSG